MLYMLNEGISRLKYEDASRGNGTMQFLQAFTTLGSFGKKNSNFKSILNVISGHTVLSCDNSVGPYTDGTHLKIYLCCRTKGILKHMKVSFLEQL